MSDLLLLDPPREKIIELLSLGLQLLLRQRGLELKHRVFILERLELNISLLQLSLVSFSLHLESRGRLCEPLARRSFLGQRVGELFDLRKKIGVVQPRNANSHRVVDAYPSMKLDLLLFLLVLIFEHLEHLALEVSNLFVLGFELNRDLCAGPP